MAQSTVLEQIRRASGGAAATPEFLSLVKRGIPVDTLVSIAHEISPAQRQILDKLATCEVGAIQE